MSLLEHLYELRARLLKSLVAVLATTVVAFIYFRPIFAFMIHPYCALPAAVRGGTDRCGLYAIGVLDQFNARLRVAIIVGLAAAAPVWLYQLWRFVTPALHRHERRWTAIFVGAASVLFGAGSALAYLFLSGGLHFLLSVAGGEVTTLLSVDAYLSYVTAMLLIFGLAFEFPLLVVMLNLAGVLPYARLKSWRRGMIFALFLFAALVTPSQDPYTMTALALALWLLYEVALVIARVHDRRAARRSPARDWAGVGDDEPSPVDLRPGDLPDMSDIS